MTINYSLRVHGMNEWTRLITVNRDYFPHAKNEIKCRFLKFHQEIVWQMNNNIQWFFFFLNNLNKFILSGHGHVWKAENLNLNCVFFYFFFKWIVATSMGRSGSRIWSSCSHETQEILFLKLLEGISHPPAWFHTSGTGVGRMGRSLEGRGSEVHVVLVWWKAA